MLRPVALTCLALALAAPAFASGADTLKPSSRTKVKEKGEGPVIVMKAGEVNPALRIEAKDGHVVIHGEADAARPWLGVLLSDPDEVEKKDMDLPVQARRWTVTAIADDSPAKRAGLERGDIIIASAGRDVEIGSGHLLEGMKPGDVVALDVVRDGSPRKLQVRLAGHPGIVTFADAEGVDGLAMAGQHFSGFESLKALESLHALKDLPCPAGTKPEDCHAWSMLVGSDRPRLGVHVEAMGEQLARYFGVESGKGLLVKDVVDGSGADDAGIEAGDVITRVAGEDIEGPGDIASALREQEAGDQVTVDLVRRGKPMTVRVTLRQPDKRGALEGVHGMPEVRAAMAEMHAALGTMDAKRQGELKREIESAMKVAAEATGPAVREAMAQARVEMERAQEAMAEARAAQPAVQEAMAQARVEMERALADSERARARQGRSSGSWQQLDAREQRELEAELKAAHEALAELPDAMSEVHEAVEEALREAAEAMSERDAEAAEEHAEGLAFEF